MCKKIMSVNQLEIIKKIYNLRRDINSEGYDQALDILCQNFPLNIHKYKSGTKCWTWEIPLKWKCEQAHVETMDGKRIIDQTENPLHVASYSCCVDKIISREELLSHLHTHPYLKDQPPFIFYYYQSSWGFGCGKNIIESLTDEFYRVVIRSEFMPGYLKVAEYYLPGKKEECFVLCGHLCHPHQVNDGLSGVVTALAVMDELSKKRERNYSYRLLITPETIGSIAWLSHNEGLIPSIIGGIFLEMTGLCQPPALQLSYYGNTQVDRCLKHVHMEEEKNAWVAPYRGIVGNDERQFNAPGVRIPMLSYSRALSRDTQFSPFKEYHSIIDNLDITSVDMLEKSKNTILAMINTHENNYYPINLFKGEVCLSGLKMAVDRNRKLKEHQTMLKIIDLIDGTNSIIDITNILNLSFEKVKLFIDQLEKNELVKESYKKFA
jgi:aminopeptidase-like protein